MKTKSLFFIVALCFAFVQCKSKREDASIPQRVKLVTVKSELVKDIIHFPGKLVSPTSINMSFRVAGMIQRLNFQDGDFVRKGEVIAKIANSDYYQGYLAAKAKYTAVQEEANRIIALYKSNSTSKNNYDKAIGALHEAKAYYQVKSNEYEYTIMRAPFDCYIQRRYMKENEVVAAGTPIVSIVGTSQLELEVDIPASAYIKQQEFDTYAGTISVYPNRPIPLKLLGINRQANFNELFKMRLSIAEDSSMHLAPGMSASVAITSKRMNKNRLQIPISALFEKNGETYVWRFNPQNETVNHVKVKVDCISKDGIATIESAIQDGDQIVCAGTNYLKEGEKVNPLPKPSSANVGNLL